MAHGKDKVKLFTPGEKVFAKVKGYRAWPAYIVREEKFPKNKVKYHVIFYQTNEKACCKPEDIYPYGTFKEKYGKKTKVSSFNRALELIEKDAPDLSKFSLAEKLSAAAADVEEIKKNTKKRALGETGAEVQKATKKLVIDEADIEETPISAKKRTLETSSEETQESSRDPEDELGSSDVEKRPKRQKLASESSDHPSPKKSDGSPDKSEHSSPKKSGKTDNLGLSNKDTLPDTEKGETVKSSDTSQQKRKVAQKKKLRETSPFRPRTVHGEDPEIHLKKVEIFKKNKEPVKGKEKKTEGSQRSVKIIKKKNEKKSEKLIQKKVITKGKKKLAKQSEKTPVSQGVAANGQNGSKQHTREQFDVRNFAKGDKVFARVKGYPPWPAIVTGSVVEKKKKKYTVSFYASLQNGFCAAEHLFPYELYKAQYGYHRIKNASLNRAIELIEEAVGRKKQKKGDSKSKAIGAESTSAKNLKDISLNGEVSSNESLASGEDTVVLAAGHNKKAGATAQ